MRAFIPAYMAEKVITQSETDVIRTATQAKDAASRARSNMVLSCFVPFMFQSMNSVKRIRSDFYQLGWADTMAPSWSVMVRSISAASAIL